MATARTPPGSTAVWTFRMLQFATAVACNQGLQSRVKLEKFTLRPPPITRALAPPAATHGRAKALFCAPLTLKLCAEPFHLMSAPCFYSRGPGTYKVQEPLPVQARSKLVASMAEAGVSHGVILLKGGISACR